MTSDTQPNTGSELELNVSVPVEGQVTVERILPSGWWYLPVEHHKLAEGIYA